MTDEKKSRDIWGLVKAICTIILTAVISVKVYQTPIELTVDFPTLLSLILALFSVGLAALFYFKATDTSNTFYDNTYKFTRDVAQVLAKIESGFGERLRNLDEGYTSMRTYLQTGSKPSAAEEIEKTKKKLADEKQEVERVIEERNRIVKDLIQRSHLQLEEKEQVAAQLRHKEEELMQMQQEVAKLNRRLALERARKQGIHLDLPDDEGMNHYTAAFIVRRLGREKLVGSSMKEIASMFEALLDDIPRQYLEDLERHGYFDGSLTPSGARYLRALARRDAT